MRTFNLLLGSSDRRVGNLIESLVRDVCGDRAIMDCTRAERIDEFAHYGSEEDFDLIVLNRQGLLPTPGRPASISIIEAVSSIKTSKPMGSAPILAVAVRAEDEIPLFEAGADLALGLPFNCEEVKSAVRRLSRFPEPASVTSSPLSTNGVKSFFERLSGALAFSRSLLH